MGVRTASAVSHAIVHFAPTTCTRHCVVSSAQEALDTQKLSPGAAAKLRGQIGWAASNSFGRCGRLAPSAFKHRQYGHSLDLDAYLHDALCFSMQRFAFLLARNISIDNPRKQCIVSNAVAEYTPGRMPRIGWLIFP